MPYNATPYQPHLFDPHRAEPQPVIPRNGRSFQLAELYELAGRSIWPLSGFEDSAYKRVGIRLCVSSHTLLKAFQPTLKNLQRLAMGPIDSRGDFVS